jgi:hypothetical protein
MFHFYMKKGGSTAVALANCAARGLKKDFL